MKIILDDLRIIKASRSPYHSPKILSDDKSFVSGLNSKRLYCIVLPLLLSQTRDPKRHPALYPSSHRVPSLSVHHAKIWNVIPPFVHLNKQLPHENEPQNRQDKSKTRHITTKMNELPRPAEMVDPTKMSKSIWEVKAAQ